MFFESKQIVLEEANKYIFVKRYDRAEKLLKRLLDSAKFDNDPLVHLRYVELGARLGKLAQVVKEYEAKVDHDPTSMVYQIAKLYAVQHGEVTTAENVVEGFQAILHEHGDVAAAYYGIGFSMELLGNYDRALFSYKKSLEVDPGFYPAAFGLSQVYYVKGDEKTGDHYFFQFEKSAPYNVYGNFETHRKLCYEFLSKDMFDEAAAAIKSLSEWWDEAKGTAPLEIKIYEAFCLTKVYQKKGDESVEKSSKDQAHHLVAQCLEKKFANENALLFIARTLEEFDEPELALEVYRNIVQKAGANVEFIQKIGGQFLAGDQPELAKTLFDEAYILHPDHPEIRFCKLVADLKVAGVDVENFLVEKERLKKFAGSASDSDFAIDGFVKLLEKYPYDPDVHGELGNLFLKAGALEKAKYHFRTMHGLDNKSPLCNSRYASFEIQLGNVQRSKAVVEMLKAEDYKLPHDLAEFYWVKTTFAHLVGNLQEAVSFLTQGLSIEPWNVSFLLQQGINLTKAAQPKSEWNLLDPSFDRLLHNEEASMNWAEFDVDTAKAEASHLYEIAYIRQKLRFVFSDGHSSHLERLVQIGSKHNMQLCIRDFIRLLNTNFDRPEIYWALGVLYKDMWQLETATTWFENVLVSPILSDQLKARVYLELADCYNWQGINLEKASQYARLSLDLGIRDTHKGFVTLAHALLKAGQVREAQIYLEHDKNAADTDTVFLQGLVQYRNGSFLEANKIWKPLITQRTENLRVHNIKQEIMKFYYEKEPYLKAN